MQPPKQHGQIGRTIDIGGIFQDRVGHVGGSVIVVMWPVDDDVLYPADCQHREHKDEPRDTELEDDVDHCRTPPDPDYTE
jgi:hypothetical protein